MDTAVASRTQSGSRLSLTYDQLRTNYHHLCTQHDPNASLLRLMNRALVLRMPYYTDMAGRKIRLIEPAQQLLGGGKGKKAKKKNAKKSKKGKKGNKKTKKPTRREKDLAVVLSGSGGADHPVVKMKGAKRILRLIGQSAQGPVALTHEQLTEAEIGSCVRLGTHTQVRSAIKGGVKPKFVKANAAQGYYRSTVIEKEEDFKRHIGGFLTAQAKLSDAVDVGVHASFNHQSESFSKTIVFFVEAAEELRTQQKLDISKKNTLCPDLVAEAEENLQVFFQKYGTHVVTGISYASSFSGFSAFRCSGSKTRADLKLQLNAAVLGKAKVKAGLKYVSESKQYQAHSQGQFRVLGRMQLPENYGPSGVIKAFQAWCKMQNKTRKREDDEGKKVLNIGFPYKYMLHPIHFFADFKENPGIMRQYGEIIAAIDRPRCVLRPKVDLWGNPEHTAKALVNCPDMRQALGFLSGMLDGGQPLGSRFQQLLALCSHVIRLRPEETPLLCEAVQHRCYPAVRQRLAVDPTSLRCIGEAIARYPDAASGLGIVTVGSDGIFPTVCDSDRLFRTSPAIAQALPSNHKNLLSDLCSQIPANQIAEALVGEPFYLQFFEQVFELVEKGKLSKDRVIELLKALRDCPIQSGDAGLIGPYIASNIRGLYKRNYKWVNIRIDGKRL